MNLYKVSCLALLFSAATVMAESNPEAEADADADADEVGHHAAAHAAAHVTHHVEPYHHPEPAPYHDHKPVYHTEPAPYAHPVKPYHHEPKPYHAPAPGPYHPQPAPYGHAPHPAPYAPKRRDHYYGPPRCSKGNPKTYCIDDYEYPSYDIQAAIEYHYDAVQKLYKDVVAITENSVDGLLNVDQETYLCPTETAYIQPVRAVNVHGKWRIIVNDVKAHYETLTQTARVEECTTPKEKCPLVPEAYDTKCIQKNIYHRFLIYDPYDEYLPFAIESFQLPSACACFSGAYALPEELLDPQ